MKKTSAVKTSHAYVRFNIVELLLLPPYHLKQSDQFNCSHSSKGMLHLFMYTSADNAVDINNE